ncbi:OmpH family outer membrane protein [Paraflavitalea soli]|nr:OmpH family outer membrane protein [Paraflavitalea soli]
MQKRYSFIVLIIILLMGTGRAGAQYKMGYIDLQQLITLMPEYHKANEMLDEYEKALLQNAQDIRDAYFKEVDSAFNKQGHGTGSQHNENMRRLREAYLKAAQFGPEQAQQMRKEKEQEIMEPVRRKAVQAIQAVAKENGYTYILSRELLITFPSGEDVLPLVARKLKLTRSGPVDPSAPK